MNTFFGLTFATNDVLFIDRINELYKTELM